jgi:hypothetical protein
MKKKVVTERLRIFFKNAFLNGDSCKSKHSELTQLSLLSFGKTYLYKFSCHNLFYNILIFPDFHVPRANVARPLLLCSALFG